MASRLISCSARSRRPEPALLAPGLHSIARVDGRRCLKWWCGVRGLQAFGESGAIVYLADCVELMKIIPPGSVDVVFADLPYRLSRGGVTVKNGRLAPVDKGAWDRSIGFGRAKSL